MAVEVGSLSQPKDANSHKGGPERLLGVKYMFLKVGPSSLLSRKMRLHISAPRQRKLLDTERILRRRAPFLMMLQWYTLSVWNLVVVEYDVVMV